MFNNLYIGLNNTFMENGVFIQMLISGLKVTVKINLYRSPLFLMIYVDQLATAENYNSINNKQQTS